MRLFSSCCRARWARTMSPPLSGTRHGHLPRAPSNTRTHTHTHASPRTLLCSCGDANRRRPRTRMWTMWPRCTSCWSVWCALVKLSSSTLQWKRRVPMCGMCALPFYYTCASGCTYKDAANQVRHAVSTCSQPSAPRCKYVSQRSWPRRSFSSDVD
jgi:hypothetical protein